MKAVKIIHPHHPLSGRTVPLIGQTTHPAFRDRQWLIELADQSQLYLPLSWAIPATSEDSPDGDSTFYPNYPWVDVPSLLSLTKMVSRLQSLSHPEEISHDTSPSTPLSRDPNTPTDSSTIEPATARLPAQTRSRARCLADETTPRTNTSPSGDPA